MEWSAPSSALPCRLPGLVACVGLLAACQDGSGSDANATAAPSPVVLSGVVTFDYVPVVGLGLDYTQVEPRPARGVTVQAVRGDEVLGTTATDDLGLYTLPVASATDGVVVRVSAEMRREGTLRWSYRVVDNTQADALFVLESAELSTGQADRTVDLHAGAGWDGTSYAETRSAAPFAILDVVYDATQFVLQAAPQTEFPPLVLHWSPDNVPNRGEDGAPDFETGEIGTSLYRPGFGIFLLGAGDSDTDEYDRHVIAHEWAHYFEHELARSDSIGGPHTRGDQLDLRTAFSEGFANALSAMITGDTIYVDVLGPQQAHGFAFDIEGPFIPHSPEYPNPNPGWFSEESIQEIVYDLYDDAPDSPADAVALGFRPIFDVMTTDMRDTPALTSIYPFVQALKASQPDTAPLIDLLVDAHAIEPTSDEFGSGETNLGSPSDPSSVGSEDILPIYKSVVLGTPASVCSTDAYNYSGPAGSGNKLGSRVFLRFAVEAAGNHRITVTTTEMPADATADPDLILHQRGPIDVSWDPPDEDVCTLGAPEGCVESHERFLGPGDYVLEVYEWTNTQPADGEHPPIGRTCFAVEVALQ